MEDVSKLTLIYEFNPISGFSPSGDFQIKMGNAGLTPFAVAPLPLGGNFKWAVKERVERTVACVNAMEGIEDPNKLREIYEACKQLELDKYQSLKAAVVGILDEIENGYNLTPGSALFNHLQTLIK